MLYMVFIRSGKHCHVVEVYDDEFIPFSHKRYVHGSLKFFSGVNQSERHLLVHDHPPSGGERCLLHVIRMHGHLIVPRETIHHGYYGGSYYFLQYMVHLGQGIIVLERTLIQIAKINT